MIATCRGRAWALALALLSGVASAGCADDDDDRTEIPCDIRDVACRRAILILTARVRNQQNVVLPLSRIITRQQFANETRAELARSGQTRQGLLFEESLRLVDLLPRDSSLDEAMAQAEIAGVAAYYQPADLTITIIDDAAEDAYGGSLTLSHEYVHALQDQREGLAQLSGNPTTDETMAISALIEGEATILSDIALTLASGLPYLREDVVSYLDALLAGVLSDVRASPAPFNLAQLALPYPVGGRPLAEGYLAEGIVGVERYFAKRPSTLAGWIDPARREQLPVALTCTTPDAPAGYDTVGLDRFGTTGLIALYTRLGLDGSAAFAAARAWANDAYAIFGARDGSNAAALAWRIRLGDEPAAISLESALRASALGQSRGLSIARSGPEVILTHASKPEVLASWTTRNECSTAKSRDQPASLFPTPTRYRQHTRKAGAARP
jgi:hypothetical protein